MRFFCQKWGNSSKFQIFLETSKVSLCVCLVKIGRHKIGALKWDKIGFGGDGGSKNSKNVGHHLWMFPNVDNA